MSLRISQTKATQRKVSFAFETKCCEYGFSSFFVVLLLIRQLKCLVLDIGTYSCGSELGV